MDTGLQSIGDIAIGQSTANGVAALSAGRTGLAKLGNGSVDKAAGDFEGMFMSQMLTPMFEGIGSDPMFGGGHGEEVMKSFLVQEYGKIVAKTGKFGLSAAVRNEMIMAQAKAGGQASPALAAATSDGGTDVPVQ